MTDPIFFPKTHESFVGDPVVLRLIATVEDFIELRYQTLSIKHAIEPIISFFSQHVSKQPKRPLPPELLADLEAVSAMPMSEIRTQLDEDREAIWSIKDRNGSLYVLGFLEPKLILSIETLFSGIVVGYIQMFNDSKTRHRLNPDRVFKSHPDLKKFHVDVIQPLRDLQYAHKNAAEGQQSLAFTIDDVGEISINQDPPHFGFEFYPENYKNLYKCVCVLAGHLDDEISSSSGLLMGKLNVDQLNALRAEWKNPTHTRKETEPMAYRESKAKFPKSKNSELE